VQHRLNKPVFVVGSPRSGRRHFAVNVVIAYQTGAARGDHSIVSAMDVPEERFVAAFGRGINDLIPRHRNATID
jgi:hypothetical protein